MTEEDKRVKAREYARAYYQRNKELISEEYKKKLIELKEDPEAYKEFREKKNENNRKYEETHREELIAKAKAANWYYNKDNAAVNRRRFYLRNVIKSILASVKHRAKIKDLPFDLTKEWYNTELPKGCAVTGLEILADGTNSAFSAHIDRKIPELGYVQSNCRLVCACYNLAKKDWTDEDVLRMAKALVNCTADL